MGPNNTMFRGTAAFVKVVKIIVPKYLAIEAWSVRKLGKRSIHCLRLGDRVKARLRVKNIGLMFQIP